MDQSKSIAAVIEVFQKLIIVRSARDPLSSMRVSEQWKEIMTQIIAVLSGSILVSLTLSLTAYQQVAARWWKGPATATVLIATSLLTAITVAYQPQPEPNHLVLTISRTAFILAITVFAGSVLALLLRPYLDRTTITLGIFASGFVASFIFLSSIDFT